MTSLGRLNRTLKTTFNHYNGKMLNKWGFLFRIRSTRIRLILTTTVIVITLVKRNAIAKNYFVGSERFFTKKCTLQKKLFPNAYRLHQSGKAKGKRNHHLLWLNNILLHHCRKCIISGRILHGLEPGDILPLVCLQVSSIWTYFILLPFVQKLGRTLNESACNKPSN